MNACASVLDDEAQCGRDRIDRDGATVYSLLPRGFHAMTLPLAEARVVDWPAMSRRNSVRRSRASPSRIVRGYMLSGGSPSRTDAFHAASAAARRAVTLPPPRPARGAASGADGAAACGAAGAPPSRLPKPRRLRSTISAPSRLIPALPSLIGVYWVGCAV